MKTLKALLIIITICFSTNTEAQIWKKLAKKAEKAVEKTLEKKVEDKTERETDKAFDSTFNNSKKNKKEAKNKNENIFGVSNAIPANTYQFSHKYVMQIDNGKKPVNIAYYLNNDHNFLGFEIPDARNKTITVMDLKENVLFMFMDNNGDKTLMSMNLNIGELTDEAIAETEYPVVATGNTKSILGYPCKEYAVKGKDMHGKVWITESAGVSFAKTFYKTKQKKGIDQSWMSMINGLPMETIMTDTSKRKAKTTTMKCVSLKVENFAIATSGYKKLM
ncbi:DUF4412 domain-containing protein [Lacinutrix sp. Bg11-31]|uniref:DUF4412 domain-containing protein n=1 Tax=Lacinutrix sp. Bg11-31 TaxID=2057808 RepID=UPI000C3159FA|nr:DUF4412 domain-containing protein [Lacinutrix sp. Bg11-31]AUC83605.1 hypothetical protein CW733_16310 [Lacinutrix sp. Bg11-31]